jgi:integrase
MGNKRMTAMKVASLSNEGFHRDHGAGAAVGLYVQVSKSAKGGVLRSWIYRFTSPITRKPRWMGLGSCDIIPLAEARDLARAARRLVQLGADPIEHRKATMAAERQAFLTEQASKMTFAACVEGYLDAHLNKFRNAKHRWQWQETLARASRAFGDLHVAAIDTPMVVKFLEPIWRETPETANRIRGRIEKVLDWARVHQFRDGENPARWKGHLQNIFSTAEGSNYAAMPFDQVPQFMVRLRERESVSAKALELLILTAARSGEVRNATWAEVDLDKHLWTVPADRMKAGKEHVVPLSKPAVALLKALPRIGAYIFPGAVEGKPLSDMALMQLLRGMDANGYKVHGFRSTFRDWAGDVTSFDREVIEHALAHKLHDKVEAAYRRGTALKKRSILMQAWADYLDGVVESGKVVPLHA